MKHFLIILFILGITSCNVGMDYEHKDFLSQDDIRQNIKIDNKYNFQISTSWFEMFHDSDLNTLIQKALNNNLSVKQVIERLKQSRYEFAIYSKKYYPMINGNGQYDFTNINQIHSYAFDTDVFKIGIDASWEFDIWGKGRYISDQYYEIAQAISYSLLDVKVSLVSEIVQNYIDLRKAQQKLNIANHNLKLQKDISKIVSDKFNVGLSDDLDLNQSQFIVQNTLKTIPPLKFQIENYKNSLAVLLGVPTNKLPLNLDKCRRNITSSYFRFNVKKLYNLPLDIIRNRPDIMLSESLLKSQNATVNQAIADLFPNLSIGATLGFISPSASSLFNNKSSLYAYNPQISIPIWNWNQLKNNIEVQKHKKEEALLKYNEATLIALSEIKNAIYSIEQEYQKNKYCRNSFLKMQNILKLTNDKYNNGLVDFTDVTIAEQNLLEAQISLAESNAQILKNFAIFYKSIGGGYNLKN